MWYQCFSLFVLAFFPQLFAFLGAFGEKWLIVWGGCAAKQAGEVMIVFKLTLMFHKAIDVNFGFSSLFLHYLLALHFLYTQLLCISIYSYCTFFLFHGGQCVNGGVFVFSFFAHWLEFRGNHLWKQYTGAMLLSVVFLWVAQFSASLRYGVLLFYCVLCVVVACIALALEKSVILKQVQPKWVHKWQTPYRYKNLLINILSLLFQHKYKLFWMLYSDWIDGLIFLF